MNIIFLNGPPRCGKDALAEALHKSRPILIEKFAKPIYSMLAGFLNVNTEYLEQTKDLTHPYLKNKTPRHALISLSEDWAKPNFGCDIFGALLAARIVGRDYKTIVVSDSGFFPELERALVDICKKVPSETINALLVHIYRPGCSFKNDSRNYVTPPNGVSYMQLHNDTDLNDYLSRGTSQILHWLKTR